MSSYATLSLGSLSLGGSRNDIDPSLIWVFRPSDKCIEQIEWWDRERLTEYIEEEIIDDYVEDNPFTCVKYRCTAAEARDRLELKGFTLEVAEACFNSTLEEDIQHYEDLVRRSPDIFNRVLQVLRSLSAKKWLNALARIVEERLTTEDLDGIPNTDEQLPLLWHMLGSHHREFYGFHGFDHRHFLRLIVEVVPPEENLIYDLTDLVVGGWVNKADDLICIAERMINEDFLLSQRIIVLAEGNTDKRILERCLNPNPPKDIDGRREERGRWVRELQGRWPWLHWGRWEVGGRSSAAAQGPYGRLRELRCAGWRENTQQGTPAGRGGASLRGRWVSCRLAVRLGVEWRAAVPGRD